MAESDGSSVNVNLNTNKLRELCVSKGYTFSLRYDQCQCKLCIIQGNSRRELQRFHAIYALRGERFVNLVPGDKYTHSHWGHNAPRKDRHRRLLNPSFLILWEWPMQGQCP